MQRRPLSEDDLTDYEAAEQLNQSNADPPDQPYKSKYAAREIWQRLRSKLICFMRENPISDDDILLNFECALTVLSYELSRNYGATDESSTAARLVRAALDFIRSKNRKGTEKQLICAYIALQNTLAYICNGLMEYQEAKNALTEAHKIYHQYKAEAEEKRNVDEPKNEDDAPWELTRSIKWACGVLVDPRIPKNENDDKRQELWRPLEDLYTHTLCYLAETYKLMGDLGMAAKYCQETLVRQLQARNYDPFDWALNTATLAVYYEDKSELRNFHRARHCLAAASAVLKNAPSCDEKPRMVAKVNRCWIKYALTLLETSKAKLLHEPDGDHVTLTDDELSGVIPKDDDPINFSIYLPEVIDFETEVACDLSSTFEEARQIFLFAQRRVNEAHSFYTLEGCASDYTEITQDYSCAFKLLAFFEADADRKCRMHKRRLDILQAVYAELNPTYFQTLRRHLAFEMGEICNEMLDLKIDIADGREGGHPNAHRISKINILAQLGIKYFTEFSQSFEKERGENEGSRERKFEIEHVRSIILARFYRGRLYGKLLTGEPHEKMLNCNASLAEYRWIVDYVDKVDNEAVEKVKSEYDICKDMVTLLPMKMDRLRQAATS